MLKKYTNGMTGLSAYVGTDGKAFFTPDLLTKLIGCNTELITKILTSNSITNYASEYLEIYIEGGFQGVTFLISAEDLPSIIDSYALLPSANKEVVQRINDALN